MWVMTSSFNICPLIVEISTSFSRLKIHNAKRIYGINFEAGREALVSVDFRSNELANDKDLSYLNVSSFFSVVINRNAFFYPRLL